MDRWFAVVDNSRSSDPRQRLGRIPNGGFGARADDPRRRYGDEPRGCLAFEFCLRMQRHRHSVANAAALVMRRLVSAEPQFDVEDASVKIAP